MAIGQEWAGVLWENRDAAIALGSVWAGIKLGGMVADTVAAVAAKTELAQASRLAAAQAAAEAAVNVEVAATSRQKVAAYLAELGAKAASAQADVAAQAAQIAILTTTREAIALSRAEVVAKMDATRVTMAQAEAQIVAARAAGAQSIALALVREGTEALTAAQARHALLLNELAVLGKQQASVNAAVAAATAAQTAATTAATTAASGLAAAQGAASIAGRALSGAVGFLGGPIGIVTTALTLGVTAWSLWGSAGSTAERKVQGEVARSTAEIVADLDKQIAKLGARNALAAAGMGELAKKGGEAAERMAALQGQINNLQSGKGLDGGAPLPEVARVDLLQKLLVQYGTLAGTVQRAEEAQTKLDKGAGNLTLTAANAEQAWRKTIDGAKTATAAHDEYKQKVDASRLALEAFKKTGAAPEAIKSAEKVQAESEKAWGAERDRKIKEMGSGSATAQSHALSAQIEAIKQGYKKIAAQTADGLDEIDSLRKQDLISEYAAVERRTALKLKDIDAQESALQKELQLARGKKDSATEQARLAGELEELTQKRVNISNQGGRDLDELIAKLLIEATNANVKAANSVKDLAEQQEAANAVFGKSKTAIEEMTLAQLQNKLAEAEGSDRFTSDYIASLNARIAAQKRYVDALNGADFKTLMGKEQDWLDQAKERASLYEDESKLAGLTALQRAKIVATRQVELKLAKELAEIDKASLSDVEKDKLRIKAREAAASDSSAAVNKVIQDDAAKSAEQIQQSLTDAIMRGGKSGADYIKDLFRTMVLRPTINALMAPVSGVINGAVNAGMSAIGLGGGGGSGASGLMGGLSNLSSASTLYSAGSYFASGVSGSMIGSAAGMGATLPGASVGIGAMAGGSGASGLLGSAGSALGAMGPVGWTALAGLAIAAVVSAQKGDTRFGSSYRYDAANDSRINGQRYVNGGQVYSTNGTLGSPDEQGVRIVGGPNGGVDFNGMSKAQAGVIDSINATYRRLGSKTTLAAFQSGFESSEKGKGFAYAGGVTSAGGVFGQGATGNGHLNRRGSMTTDQAAAGYASELKQATLQALQSAADIPKSISNALAGVDIDALSDQALDQLSGAIDKQITDTDALRTALLSMPFESLKHLSFDAASGLIAASGGLEQLSANLNSYQENFFTEEEKRATKVMNITKIINDAGGNVSENAVATASRAQARAYIESVDVTTEQGQKLKAALLSVAGALASITDAATVAGSELASAISSAMGDLDKASERAAADRISAYRSEASALQSTMDKHLAYADQLKKFRDSLLLGSQSPLTPAQRYAEASKQFDAAQASGDAAALQSASSAFLEASKVYNASNSTYTSDFAAVQQALTKAAINSSASADVARLQLNAVNAQLSSLQQIDRGVMSVGQAMERLSAAVMASVNAGLNPGVASIARLTGGVQNQQVGNYYSSSAGAAGAWGQNGLQIYTPGGQQFSGADAIKHVNDLAAAGNGRRIYDDAKGAGLSMVSLNQLMSWAPGSAEQWAKDNGLPTFAKGGVHDGGWAMVGERGPEMAYMPPARIYNASDTNRFMTGGQPQDTRALEAKVDALLQEIQKLRLQQREETGALIASNYDANSKNADALAQSRDRARWSKREPEFT